MSLCLALITMFDRAGGDLTNQKSYSRDPRHLVLLNGFHLQVQVTGLKILLLLSNLRQLIRN